MQQPLQVFGHRGAIYPSHTPYENSLEAYRISIKMQDGFECDVCRTADGELFLVHEAKYADYKKGVVYALAEHLDDASILLLNQRRLDEISAKEAEALRLKDGQPLPKLKDVLPLFSGTNKTLIAELKGFNVVLPLVECLKKAFADGIIKPEQVVIGGFNHPGVMEVKKHLPKVRTNFTFVGLTTPSAVMFPWYDDTAAVYRPFLTEGYMEYVFKTFQPDYVMVPHQEVGGKGMREIAKKYPYIQQHSWVFTELAEGLSERSFMKVVADAHRHYNLTGVVIDIPEKTEAYKELNLELAI